MFRPVSTARSIGAARMAASGAMLLAGAASLPAATARADEAGDRTAVLGALQASAAGWSRNDLETFMGVYEDAPSTTYLKGPTIIHGFGAIRAMYAARFDKVAGANSALGLDVLDFRPLGPDYALAIGRFRLTPASPASPPATGMFTLVFHRTPLGWKIVSDHTSS